MRRDCPQGAHKAPVIGLLGAVASGKSTVARLLAARGASVVDADRIGHEVLGRPAIKGHLREAFGDGIFAPDGEVERGKLAEMVFGHADLLERLNAIVHPAVFTLAAERVQRERCCPGVPLVVLDAALLLEKGLDSCCDLLVFVECGEQNRRRRARLERGWTAEHLASRDSAQISADRKRRRADTVIRNDGTQQELEKAVAKLVDTMAQKFPIPSE